MSDKPEAAPPPPPPPPPPVVVVRTDYDRVRPDTVDRPAKDGASSTTNGKRGPR